MKLLSCILLISAIFGLAKGQYQEDCHNFLFNAIDGTCKQHTSDQWTTQGSACNSVYGNIGGNKHNLGKIMKDNLKQSFQFIAMVKLKFTLISYI